MGLGDRYRVVVGLVNGFVCCSLEYGTLIEVGYCYLDEYHISVYNCEQTREGTVAVKTLATNHRGWEALEGTDNLLF